MNDLTVAFIGCGAVGQCLGKLLHDTGIKIEVVCCRTAASASLACEFMGGGAPMAVAYLEKAAASAPVILIATPDTVIPQVAATMAPGIKAGTVVLHLSGALPSTILAPCRLRGASVGSMHPLQSFADPAAALSLVPGSVFACEGDEEALSTAFTLAESMGGRPIRIETDAKAIYHAAAAAASNFLIAPLLLALDLMESAGIGRETGLDALRPLITGTAQNAALRGVPDALTGPIERGDALVIRGHLESMERVCPELKDKYLELARMTLEAAQRKGSLTPAAYQEMKELLYRQSPPSGPDDHP